MVFLSAKSAAHFTRTIVNSLLVGHGYLAATLATLFAGRRYFSLASALGLDTAINNPDSANRAVIIGETLARKGIGKDYEPAFDQPLRDGAEFSILSQTNDWTFGHFEGIGDGWVRNDFVAR